MKRYFAKSFENRRESQPVERTFFRKRIFCKVHEMTSAMNISRRKGKGLEWRFVRNHSWSNWGLQYQLGQVCQAKSSPQNSWNKFCRLAIHYLWIQNLWQFRRSKLYQRTLTSWICLEIFMQNGKVGKGDVFFSRKRLYCLNCMKISTKVLLQLHQESVITRMKVQQCVRDRSCYFLQHH
jgi:hypothetical protein